MKELLVDLTPLYGRRITGLEIYGIEFYKALLKTQYKIIPVFRKENTIDDNPNSIIIPYDSRLYTENIALPQIIKKLHPFCAFFPIFPPPLNCYNFNTLIIPTIHDIAFKLFRDTLSWKARLYLIPKYNKALKRSHKIITISNTVAMELAHLTSIPIINCNENISPRYSLTEKDFSLSEIKKYDIRPYKYIVSVSTLEPRKNLIYLLRIWREIVKSNPYYKLVLTGRIGWEKNKEVKEICKELSNSIVHTGYVSFTELINLYHFSKAFTLLSLYEGFGRPPIEALACGAPVIVSDIPVFRENLSSYGVTFLPLNDLEKAVDIFNNFLKETDNERFYKPNITHYFSLLDNTLAQHIGTILS